jgi:hypothetical protein
MCKTEGCNKNPTYNFFGEKKRLYCAEHALEGMVDVAHKKCEFNNCTKQPSFNYKNEKRRLYCSKHALEGMIDISKKKFICNDQNCNTIACFNFKNEKKAIYCFKHKFIGMINVVSKTCKQDNCNSRAYYNYKFNKIPIYCKNHSLKNMIFVCKNYCLYEKCFTEANYNFENEKKGIYCSKHKLDLMIDVGNKRCINEWCNTQVTKKYDGYCAFCFRNMFPDHELTRNYKTKEKCVADFIKENFPDKDWICDKRVQEGCSKRRPDLLLDLGYQVLIIEVDENQHIDYDTTCEKKRLNDIAEDLNFRPIIFIRFNPDQYDSNDNHIESCWKINSKGQCVIKNHTDWNNRLNILKENVEKWINPENQLNELIHIIQLFYDN